MGRLSKSSIIRPPKPKIERLIVNDFKQLHVLFFRIFGSAVFIMGRGIDELYLPKQIEFHQIRYNIITKAVEYYVNSWTYEYISKF